MSTMFNRKHYKEIASRLNEVRPLGENYYHQWQKNERTAAVEQWHDIRDNFSDMFAKDNERFDREKFDTACGECK